MMITEEKIIKIFKENEFRATLKEGDYVGGIYKEHFARIANEIVKNINYDAVLAPVFYTDDYLKWLNKYFVKVDKVFEYCRANKKEYFTKEQLHKRYEKAMLESPFK